MLTYLEKLRRKPEAEKRKSVFLISLCVTLAVALIWAVVLSIRIARTDFSMKEDPNKRVVPSLSETFSSFGDRLNQIFSPDNTYQASTTDK